MFVNGNLRQRKGLPESLRKVLKSCKGCISDAAPHSIVLHCGYLSPDSAGDAAFQGSHV